MRTSSLDKKQQGKQGNKKAATKPDPPREAEEKPVGGRVEGGEGGAGKAAEDKAPRKSGRTAQEEDYKGAKKALRRALKAKVKKERAEIARFLVEKIKSGDMGGAKVALVLMDHTTSDGKNGKKKRSGPSYAELLMSEPEWEGEGTATTAEAGAGAREPEM